MKGKIKVGILVALQQELSTLTHKTIQTGSFFLLSDHVVVYLTGMGYKNAEKAAKKMINEGCNVLISWGTAASLDENLHAGTLCIPDAIALSSEEKLPVSRQLHTIVSQQIADQLPVATSTLAHAPHILSSVDEKIQLHESTNAASADMESAAILKTANEENIPFIALRAISDSLTMSIPSSVINASFQGGINIPQLIFRLLIRPGEWFPVIRLALNFRKAEQTLDKAAQILLLFFRNTFSEESCT